MFSRISRSWTLVKASWAVLRADKELIIFPVIAMFAAVIVMITFIVPTIAAGLFDNMSDNGFPAAGYVVAFCFYVVMYTVNFFFSSALVGAAMIRLRGGDPTVRDGFRIAFEHFGVILQYALIAATVGMLLKFLRERGGIVGSIIAWIGGLAWNVATFLVVPILVVEDVSPIDAIKRSTRLLKDTWGEQIIGNISIGLIFGLLTLAVIVVVGAPLVALAAAVDSVMLMIVSIGIVVVLVIGIQMISTALNGIYVAAVYRYAVEGSTSDPYLSDGLIQDAFRQK